MDDQHLAVEAAGPGEWIVNPPSAGRALHVFRVSPCDWLVSEVGRGTEGRGADVAEAIAGMSINGYAPDWWQAVPAALDEALMG